MAKGSSLPPGDGKHFSVTFTWGGGQDGKVDQYGVFPDGKISMLKRNRIAWVDTGVQLPAVTDTDRS